MKKLLLVISTIALSTGAFAQLRVAPGIKMHPQSIPMRSAKVNHTEISAEQMLVKNATSIPGVAANVTPSTASFANVTETIIGSTQYDLQSNRGMGKRIVRHANNTLSATWTMIPPGGASADRGSGYSYFDGTTWTSTTSRVEYKRTGFSNIAATATTEYILSHSGDSGLILSYRPIGTGNWSFSHPVGSFNMYAGQADVWGRLAVGGTNGTSVHVIVNSQGTNQNAVLGQSGPMTYSRSLDGGLTWDKNHELLPGSDSTQYLGFSAENYHIDCRGDIVAVVAGGFEQDITLWKSTDNGSTWTKTIVFAFPIPLYNSAVSISDVDLDGFADTIETASEDPTVSIDQNGICHVAFGAMRLLDDVDVDASSYFPTTDGLYYWNENMTAGPELVAFTEDFNGNGFIDLPEPLAPNTQPLALYGTAGAITHPSIGFDDDNNILLVYAAPNEAADTAIYQCAHRHTYVIASGDMGATWTTPENVVPSQAQGGDGEYQEGVFCAIARDNNGSVSTGSAHAHIVYQRDGAPYVSALFAAPSTTNATLGQQQSWNQDPNNIPYTNDIVYADVTGITIGVKENSKEVVDINVAPNPASDFIKLTFNMPKSETTTFEMMDVLGKVVLSKSFGTLNAGTVTQTIDITNLPSGAYMFTMNSESFRSTGKVIVK